MFPFQRKVPQRELIFFTQAAGKIKVEHQNVLMPVMTVLISNNLPANERDLELQEENFPFIY